MSTVVGAEHLSRLFLVVFLVMLLAVPLYSFLVARLSRQKLVPVVYRFFSLCFCVFAAFLYVFNAPPLWLANSIFVVISVFSLFAVSVFWSLMADLFQSEQSKKFFGVIAAGGSIGALLSSLSVSLLAAKLGLALLLLFAVLFLELALLFVRKLETVYLKLAIERTDTPRLSEGQAGTGGSIWEAFLGVFKSPYLIGICLFILLGKLCGTTVYLQLIDIVNREVPQIEQRTQFFALENFAVQIFSILLQLFAASRLIKFFGLAITLSLLPLALVFGLGLLVVAPVLISFFIVQVLQRSIAYGIASPTEKVLFTVVTREQKYKAKNFIDTVVTRGGDVTASSIYASVLTLGYSGDFITLCALPIAVIWMGVGFFLGREQQNRATLV